MAINYELPRQAEAQTKRLGRVQFPGLEGNDEVGLTDMGT